MRPLLRLSAAVIALLTSTTGCGDDAALGAGGSNEGGSSAPGSGGSGTGAGGAGGDGGGSEEIPAVEDPSEPAPVPPSFTDAELASLKVDIDAALASATASHSALIVGLETEQVVYERAPDTLRKPASNTKLFTAAALLRQLGDAHRTAGGAYATSVSGGVVQGDLVLFAQHDPSSSTWFADGARQPFDALASELAAAGITRVTGGVVARGEFIYEGNSLGTLDVATERTQAAAAFRASLVAAGITVDGGSSGTIGLTPPSGATLLAKLPSASVDVLSHAINVPSHNELADLAMRHLGYLGSGTSSYAAGFGEVQATLDELGVARTGLLLNDGSGLSHDNRVSARHLVELMRALSNEPEWPAFVRSLAIAGLRGTTAGRMTGTNTAGHFWGKTGTLTGVITLSGVLYHRHDGQQYLVSLLANDVANPTSARAALDAAVGALGGNRRGSTGLPARPELLGVHDDANAATVQARWSPVDGAQGYLVWRSADGKTWRRDEARYTSATTFRTLAIDGELHVRVSAVGAHGEGPPSSVLSARASDDGARVLVVDANARYAKSPVPENPLAWGHDGIVAHTSVLSGSYESCATSELTSGNVDLGSYDRVVWVLGRESTADETFSVDEQERVRAFVEAGGRLFVSGSELGYDLVGEGSPDDVAFAREVLGIGYVADDAATTLLSRGPALGTGDALARFSKLGQHEVDFPDVLSPENGGTSCLRYARGLGGSACVYTTSSVGARVVAMGVPLEALDDPELGRELLRLLED
jgi:D-alanyl-D-alanine carboxypeptidase